MLRRVLLAWGAVGRTWGVWAAPAITLVLFGWLRTTVAAGMALDGLLFPRLRRTKVTRPIVIVGNPRTGTTFLQRFLAEHVGAGMPLWRMLYPSLVLQAAIRPVLPLLERVSPARHHSTVAHDTSLTSVETDDVAVFFRYFDGFFLYGFLLAWRDEDLRDLFDPRVRDTSARDFAWLDALWRRSLVASGRDRVVAKLFSLGTRLPAFFEAFPDARVLYLVRDPVAVIPSGLSLVSGVLDQRFGFWKLPDDVRKRWIERMYDGLVTLMRRFHEDYTSGRVPRDKVLVVRYDRMMSDLEGVMAEICAFVGHEPDDAFRDVIRQTAESQRAYASKHGYDLARFGLDADRIRRDCAFVYETFLP